MHLTSCVRYCSQIRPGAIEVHPDELALVVNYEVSRSSNSKWTTT
jgi:hypothetical protein